MLVSSYFKLPFLVAVLGQQPGLLLGTQAPIMTPSASFVSFCSLSASHTQRMHLITIRGARQQHQSMHSMPMREASWSASLHRVMLHCMLSTCRPTDLHQLDQESLRYLALSSCCMRS